VEAGGARAAVRGARVGRGARLADVVAELGEREALDLFELRARRGVVRCRAGLREEQAFVALVAAVAREAGGIRVRRGRGAVELLRVRRAADARERLRLDQERLAGVALAGLHLAAVTRGIRDAGHDGEERDGRGKRSQLHLRRTSRPLVETEEAPGS